jgi:hypothetical protein
LFEEPFAEKSRVARDSGEQCISKEEAEEFTGMRF